MTKATSENSLFLCYIHEIEENACKEFEIPIAGTESQIFVIKKNNTHYAYLNQCPHTGVTLNWQPDTFLDVSLNQIQCGTHGAMFTIEEGYCTSGPCAGKSLSPVKIAVVNDNVRLIHE